MDTREQREVIFIIRCCVCGTRIGTDIYPDDNTDVCEKCED